MCTELYECMCLLFLNTDQLYNRTWHDDKGVASLNSEGLPNNGIDYYISSSTIHETMGDNPSNKPYMVSISGKNLEQNLDMLKKIAEVVKNQDESSSNKIAAVELNLACPNIGKAQYHFYKCFGCVIFILHTPHMNIEWTLLSSWKTYNWI